MQAGGSVSISGASAWKLYDADMALLLSAGSGSVNNAPAGAYLLLYGAPGASITLMAASAQ